jgi:hypothetical protein
VIEATCHCGAVHIEVETAPAQVTSCNCSICRRTGVLCTYYTLAQVRISGETDTYQWGDRDITFHRCKTCGCQTHWWPNIAIDRVGVNARLMPPEVLGATTIRKFDGAAM